MTFCIRVALLALATLNLTEFAIAQGLPPGMVPPRRMTNGRGVDLVGGQMQIDIPLVSFGQHGPGLAASVDLGSGLSGGHAGSPANDFSQRVGAMIGANMRPQAYSLGAAGNPDEFGPYESIVFPTRAGFTQQLLPNPRWNPDQSWSIHTNPDGSRYTHSFGTTHFTNFGSSDPSRSGVYDAEGNRGLYDAAQPSLYLFQKIVFANGEEWRFYRQYLSVPCTPNCQTSPVTIHRVRFVTSSRGYGIQFLYQSDATPANNSLAGQWLAPRRVTAYNKAISYCDESLLVECPALSGLPSAEITYNSAAKTVLIRQPDAAEGTELSFALLTNQCCVLSSMRQTAVPNSTVSFQYGSDNTGGQYMSTITDANGAWHYWRTYLLDDSGRQPLMHSISTDPNGGTIEVAGYGIYGSIQSLTDELSRPYYFSDGFPFRDWGTTSPQGIDTYVSRDERNNVTAVDRTPAPGSGQPTIRLYSASYPADCMNLRTCNRPASTTDANNNVTDYTYAPDHGGVLTETGPAVNGVRPQKRYEYAQRVAWTSNGSGGYVAGAPIWLLTRTRMCRTTAASGHTCAGGAADEVITDYDYGPNSGPNNLLLRGTAVTAHDGTAIVTLRTCYRYDNYGNRISETRPTANLASCP